MSENKPMSLEEFIGTMRNQIIVSHSQAEEVALKNFDLLAKKYADLLIETQNKPAPKVVNDEVVTRELKKEVSEKKE